MFKSILSYIQQIEAEEGGGRRIEKPIKISYSKIENIFIENINFKFVYVLTMFIFRYFGDINLILGQLYMQ